MAPDELETWLTEQIALRRESAGKDHHRDGGSAERTAAATYEHVLRYLRGCR